MPKFDDSSVLILNNNNIKSEDDSIIHKAYEKKQNLYVSLLKYENFLNLTEAEISEIMLKDDIFQAIELIRTTSPENTHYFPKYFGVFIDKNEKALILQSESGFCTLEEIIKSGKSYTSAEILYFLQKMAQILFLLESNGLSHRDLKSNSVILVENPNNETGFLYKIADFDKSCKIITENATPTVPCDSISDSTKEFYASPEILRILEKKSPENDFYNPFISDVYSLGVIALKMMNKGFGRKDIKILREKLKDYDEVLIEILEGILQENYQKRWSFQRILTHFREKEVNMRCPNDELEFYHKFLIENQNSENLKEKNLENLEKYYEEHMNLFLNYRNWSKRPKEEKFQLDRVWETLKLIEQGLNGMENVPKEIKWALKERNFHCLIYFGEFSKKMGNLTLAEDYFTKARKIMETEQKDSENNSKTSKIMEMEAETLANFGSLYENMGNLKKAEEFHLKSLTIRQSLYGENHTDLATSMNNLGLLYKKMQNLPKAEEFYLKSLKNNENLFGEKHSEVATSLNNLGLLYFSMNNLEKAEENQIKSLKIRQEILGETHPDVAVSLNNLGMVYYNMGKLTEAQENFQKSLKVYQSIFGENHSDVALSLNNLGLLCKNRGNVNRAEEYYQKSLKIYQNIFGENHPDVATALNNLGGLYYNIWDLQKAEEFFLKSLKIRETIYGEIDSNVASSLSNLSFLYDSNGKKEEALNFALKAYKMSDKIYGPKHPETVKYQKHYQMMVKKNK